MALYGIDVSSNQPAGIGSMVANDFVIVKASGNPPGFAWDYINPYHAQQTNEALARHGRAGLYHFTYGIDAVAEADLFLRVAEPYIGRVVLVIDYEGDGALAQGREWLRTFIRRIKERTGINPIVYASSSVIVSQSLGDLCAEEDCAIWCANYYRGYEIINGYDTSGCVIGYDGSALWQFTSVGRLDGYNDDLDLNVFFGDGDAWSAYATGNGSVIAPSDQAASKDIDTLASEVMAGKWGNGDERQRNLAAAGYDYDAVQARVNEICGAAAGKSVDELAKEVIDGVWGNGSERRGRLEAAGYDPDAVQSQVNEMCQRKIHVVQSGETLSGIASLYGTTYQRIADVNHIDNPNVIYAGQRLVVE